MKFNERLEKIRKEKNLSVDKVCERSGIKRRTYYDYEKGIYAPTSIETYYKLSKGLGCDMEDLIKPADIVTKNISNSLKTLSTAMSKVFTPSSNYVDALVSSIETSTKLSNEKIVNRIAKKQKKFKALASSVILSNLNEKNIRYQIDQNVSSDLRMQINLDNEINKVNKWRFNFCINDIDDEELPKVPEELSAKLILANYLRNKSNENVIYTCVIDEKKVYDELKKYKESNPIKQNISILLFDEENLEILDETYLSKYDDTFKEVFVRGE